MSVNEIQALAQKFANAFDRRDIKTVLDMLSDDVEVFDTVPYRFYGKSLFAKFLNEAFEGIASTSFGLRQPSCRVYNDIVGIVNAYDMFRGRHQGRQADSRRWPDNLDLYQTGHAMEDCKLPLLAHAPYALKEPESMLLKESMRTASGV
jgi:ketosteroid isomerase-like protein